MKMIRSWMIPALIGVFGMMMAMSGSLTATEKEAPEKVLRHLVLYKFRDDVSKEQVQEVIDTFAGLPKQIDSIVGFEHGPNTSTEGKSDGLTYCFMVSFRDEKGRDAYLTHPAHQAYVNVVKNRREKVVVFDYWATK